MMPIDEYRLPLAPQAEAAADGWVPGQPECREPACSDERDGFNERCQKHQTKRETTPVDWDAVRQSGAQSARRGRRRR